MNKLQDESVWLSIFEYSKKTGKSISTIRRYIKSKRVVSQLIDGKFYIFENTDGINNVQADSLEDQMFKLEKQVGFLKKQLVVAQEEISELKMLVNLYEKQISQKSVISDCNKSEKHIQ